MLIIIAILIFFMAVAYWFFIRAISDGDILRVIGSVALMVIIGGLGTLIDGSDKVEKQTHDEYKIKPKHYPFTDSKK